MSYDLPPYSVNARCSKCSGDAIASTYLSDFQWPNWRGCEVLRRSCSRCGYLWDEAPMDRVMTAERSPSGDDGRGTT